VCPGSATECLYSLQSFGILSERIPMKNDSVTPRTEQHLKWLDFRQRKEDAIRTGTQFNEIEFPELKDVLLGRGQPLMRHPGQVLLLLYPLHILSLFTARTWTSCLHTLTPSKNLLVFSSSHGDSMSSFRDKSGMLRSDAFSNPEWQNTTTRAAKRRRLLFLLK
jgi:hypothetical protein